MIYSKCMRVIVSAIAVLPFCCVAATTKAPDNLSGIWQRDYVASNFLPQTDNKSTDKVFTLGDGTVIPLRPEAEKVYRQRVAMGETAQVFANTTARCLPLGTPQNMMGAPPYPIRIVQTADFIAILLEEGWEFRAIYVGGKHPQEMVAEFHGPFGGVTGKARRW